MASNEGNMAAVVGGVFDEDGNAVHVLAAPDGTVVVECMMGSFELAPRARDEFRELLDRAAMPGQSDA
jgi:hypothetical protein